MPGIDLIDLRILDQLQRTSNISRVAEKVGLSQPSVSVRLSRLRQHFKDPLFVRTSHGMRPTPRADAVITAARQALGLFERAVAPEGAFESATSQRTFRICMTDVGQIAILPKLLTRLNTVSPGVCIDVLNPTDEIERMLEIGEVDIAIGVTLDKQKGLSTQALFRERFACLVGKNHRRVGKSITVQQFLKEAHVATNIRSASTGLWVLDQALNNHKISRRIALKVPSLLGLSQIVANTDLLAIVPLHLGLAFAEEGHVKVLELPINLPSYRVMQYWHQRYHLDPGHRWLRGILFELFAD